MRSSKHPDEIGSKLGPKLVQLISQTVAATKLKLLDTEHRARVNSMQEIIDRAGREVADLYRPVMQSVIKDLELPDEVADFVEKTTSGVHQWHALAGMGFYGSGAQSAISTMLSNFIAPGVRYAVSRDPQLVPSGETIAQMLAKGVVDNAWAEPRSSGQGYADDVQNALTESSKNYPDLTTAVELIRRGVINVQQAKFYLQRNGVPETEQDRLMSLIREPLSPADVADMVVRGIMSEADGAKVASESGMTSSDFDLLVLDTGEPIALMQLLEAKRRGFIDEARLRRGILQSRIRNEWIDVAEKLAYEPMSVADAVNAVVQNHMSQQQGESIAQQNGLEPGMFGILYETAGEPLSRTEMEELYNRGLVTQDDVNQALRESRVKNKYVDLAFQLHRKIPPIFTVQRALAHGAISHDQAVTVVMESGYTKSDAEWIVAAGSAQATTSQKTKVISAVEAMYVDNMISSADAVAALKAQGLSAADADAAVTASEFRREARITTQVLSSIRTRYVGRKVTRNVASGLIDNIGLPTSQRDTLLNLWDIELSANTRALTEAQIVKAVAKQLITSDDGLARLVAMGYSDTDATLLLEGA